MKHGPAVSRRVRRILGLTALLAALPGLALAADAIVGATVYTLDSDEPLENATILVNGGRIEAVGADLAVPDGFERIDAGGRIVTPGLIEPYSQLGLVEIGGEPTTVDSLVTHVPVAGQAGVEPLDLGPAFDVQYAINPASTLLPVNRLGGVTRAVVAPLAGNDPLAGWGASIRLADPAGGADILTHPRLALFGLVDANSALLVGGSRSAVIQRLWLVLEQAASYRPGRYRADPNGYAEIEVAAVAEFLESGAPLVLTVHRAAEIRQLLALAEAFDLNLVLHGGSEAWMVAHALAAAGVPVILDALDNLPLNYDRLGARLDNAALLHAAGVTVLFTAEDSHNARLLRQVAGNAVAEGLPWQVALAAITRAPAETFALGEGVGTLTAGAPADLAIWTGDPLELTTWAERVMIGGRWVPMTSRQTRLLERYRHLDGERPFGFR